MSDPRNRVFEGVLELVFEDSGCSAIGEVVVPGDTEDGPFVRLQSWEEEWAEDEEKHEWLRSLENKRVRVTVEVL